MHDEPLDPFRDDPVDPVTDLDESDEPLDPLSEDERGDVEEDLADLEVFEALLGPVGIRGLVIDCEDCREPHYFDWALLRANLRHLLDSGRPRVHEPAFDPDPDRYVTWDYAHGYTDGVHDTLLLDDEPSDEVAATSAAAPGPEGPAAEGPAVEGPVADSGPAPEA